MRYAAYGSNLHPLRLAARTPSATLIGRAALPGFSLHFHKRSPDGSGKCNILPGGDGVWLAVYELDESEKPLLDEIEGVGCGYHDEVIDVPGFGHCAIYLGQDGYLDDRLSPWCWYHRLVYLGARFQRFPADYLASLDAVPFQSDPDAARREAHAPLIRQIETQVARQG